MSYATVTMNIKLGLKNFMKLQYSIIMFSSCLHFSIISFCRNCTNSNFCNYDVKWLNSASKALFDYTIMDC